MGKMRQIFHNHKDTILPGLCAIHVLGRIFNPNT